MPLYEYRCNHCGREFEKMVRFSEAANSPECPDCNSHETSKKISIFASHGTSAAATAASSSCSSSSGRFT